MIEKLQAEGVPSGGGHEECSKQRSASRQFPESVYFLSRSARIGSLLRNRFHAAVSVIASIILVSSFCSRR